MKLADGKGRTIQNMIATSYWNPDGKPISANQMVERLFGEIPRFFKDEDELRRIWSKPDTRKALLDGMTEGFGRAQLSEISRIVNAENRTATYTTCWPISLLHLLRLRVPSG